MTYFYVTNEGQLVRLASFALTEGQSCVVRIPVIGGSIYQRTRKEPDTFVMVASGLLPQVAQFRVVDENAVVYGCVGNNTIIRDGSLVVSGIVYDRWEAEQKAEAVQAIRQAMGS
jgi:hypothetical protein